MDKGSEGAINISGPDEAMAQRASHGTVTTLEAVVIKADGSRVDYGVVASSDPERVPLSQRPEEE